MHGDTVDVVDDLCVVHQVFGVNAVIWVAQVSGVISRHGIREHIDYTLVKDPA